MKKQQIKKTSFLRALIMVLCLVIALTTTACGSAVSISLDKTETKMYVGDSVKLTATVTGDDDAEVEWSSDNISVATVKRGTIQAIAKGTATITAQLESGEKATCAVTVDERTVTLSQTTATINLDESKTLTLTATASDGGAITWNTSDPAVATVEGGGSHRRRCWYGYHNCTTRQGKSRMYSYRYRTFETRRLLCYH